jgi:hypothetical protein
VIVQPFEDSDGAGRLFDDYPRVITNLAFGDLIPFVVYRTFEFPSSDSPEPGHIIVGDAPALQVEHYWRSARIPNVRYSAD